MKTATEIQLEALTIAYDSLRLYTKDMEHYEYESDTEREWVGLTDDEINETVQFPYHFIPFARAIEYKLKKKNT